MIRASPQEAKRSARASVSDGLKTPRLACALSIGQPGRSARMPRHPRVARAARPGRRPPRAKDSGEELTDDSQAPGSDRHPDRQFPPPDPPRASSRRNIGAQVMSGQHVAAARAATPNAGGFGCTRAWLMDCATAPHREPSEVSTNTKRRAGSSQFRVRLINRHAVLEPRDDRR